MTIVLDVVSLWAVPFALVLLGAALGFLVRRWLYRKLAALARRTQWEGDDVIVQATRWHVPLLAFVGGVYLATRFAPLSEAAINLIDKALAGLVTVSVTWMTAGIVSGLIRLYARRLDVTLAIEPAAQQVALITISGTGLLFFLGAVGIPPTPLLLVIGIAALGGALALRNILPEIFAGVSMAVARQVQRGERIRLETGEEGVVTELGWRTTILRTERGDVVIVPNSRVASGIMVKVRPAPRIPGTHRAGEPFRFYTRLVLPELTGLRATTLRELVEHLEHVPLSVIYYHSLYFIQEHQHLTPQPVSDFARWVSDALDYRDLGEVLALVDPCQYVSLEEFRQRLVALVRDYLATHSDDRPAPAGQELFLMKSRILVFHTGREAHTLQELAHILRDVTIDSLHFHLFEARLRLGRPINDFSAWIERHFGDKDLAGQIALLDPYTRTGDGLRNALVALIEERT